MSTPRLPTRVRAYLDALSHLCVSSGHSLVSVVLFGSAAKDGFSDVSDVDLIIVVADGTPLDDRRRLRDSVTRLEIAHGFRPIAAAWSGALKARIDRAAGHLFPCCVCTRSDLVSGDLVRVLDLRPWEAPFVDRITFASIMASAVTVGGEDLLHHVPVPPVRRLDVLKALFAFSCQVVLSVMTFPVLPDATRYAMGALKHSLHSCYFCYHQQTATLEEEVDFFERRLGRMATLQELLSLRRQYRRSFAFVIRCLPALGRLHLQTARDNQFPGDRP
jgi:hypothetical protein